MAWHRYLALGLIGVIVVLAMVWEPSPAVTAGFGWLLIATGFAALALSVFKRPPASATVQPDPLWQTTLSNVGLMLMGLEKIWPEYRVASIGMAMLFVPILFHAIRRYRETNGESIV